MAKVVIDAGHGGDDPGAVGNGIIEKDYTLKISKYIYNKLKQLGVDVKLTRDSDITLSPSDRTKKVLDSYGNSSDVLVISNHINAGGGDGAEVIYALRNNEKFPKLVLDNLKKKGQNVRKYYRKTLPSNSSKDYYFMLRDTGNTDAYIIEYGFLDSKSDDVNQLKNNWQSYADAVVDSIIEYLGINRKNNTYVVKRGDTLWSIAKANNLSVEQLKNLNNLNSNLISIGQVLSLDNNNIYIVKKGDTLYSIARLNNTTVNNLMNLNNLINYNIYVGQKLKIK